MDVDAAAPVLMKRKGAEAPEPWLDDGGGFPDSSRAAKIRRLDAAVPHVVVPGAGVPSPPQPQPVAGFGVEEVPICGDVALPVPVEVAPTANEERTIVLYRPAEAARNLLLGPLRPGVPLRVSPDWIHGLKYTMLQEASNHRLLLEGGDESSNLAMVPWAPSHSQAASTAATATETMDSEDSEGTSMEVEQDRADQLSTAGAAQGDEALHQQWPRHCMVQVQQPLPAASYQPSPVTWSW